MSCNRFLPSRAFPKKKVYRTLAILLLIFQLKRREKIIRNEEKSLSARKSAAKIKEKEGKYLYSISSLHYYSNGKEEKESSASDGFSS